ncbi:MAG: VWA domain-containing protein [Pirellulales bacterium]|nr:VWA domain-containing protein [Pirellulales bacterium]
MISCAWKTRLLLPLAEQGEGLLRNHIRWNWELPLWTSLLLAILAAIWVIAVYARENPVAGKRLRRLLVLLRLAGIGLALVMLAQPVREWYRLTRPGLVVLLDRSASMGTVDAAGLAESSSRMEAWQATLSGEENSLLSRWQQSYQLEVVTFDQQFMRLAASPDELFSKLRFLTLSADSNGGTRLGDAVLYALRELPGPAPAAIVVFSDGVSTGGRPLREAAQIAEGLRVPLFTVAIGREHPPADIGLEDLLVEDIVLPGDRLQVAASLRATGYAGQSAQVTLRQTGRDLILAQTTMELPADGTTQMVRLAMRPEEPGKLELELAVECMPGEVNLENNVLRRSVEVRDDKVRVLLVQSIPSYEYRALKSLLERDPVVELSVVLQEADVDFAQVDQAALRTFPASAAGLYQYDVVLWGDVDPDALPRAVGPLLEQFVVQHGGGLACIAGPQFMPSSYRGNSSMELLLPIDLQSHNPLRWQADGKESYRIQPTALGWQDPSLQLGSTRAESESIWRQLPPIMWLLEIDRVKPGVQVLAEFPRRTDPSGQPRPAVLRHYVGAGEVFLHATDETWRWRWQTDDRYFARYWGQVVRRLGRGRLASGRQGVLLTADRPHYLPGETVRLQARFRDPTRAPAGDAQVVVQLQTALGSPREVRLERRLNFRGTFAAECPDLGPGDYTALLARPDMGEHGAEARFSIAAPPRELHRVAADHTALRALAELTGGSFCTLDRAEELADKLPQPRSVSLEEQPRQSLWNTHLVMAVFVAILCSEWILRRRHGML